MVGWLAGRDAQRQRESQSTISFERVIHIDARIEREREREISLMIACFWHSSTALELVGGVDDEAAREMMVVVRLQRSLREASLLIRPPHTTPLVLQSPSPHATPIDPSRPPPVDPARSHSYHIPQTYIFSFVPSYG